MKRTAFFPIHQALGAKMVEFAGYEMPIQYTSIHEEHHAVRRSVGVFDVSHMGELHIRGKDALSLVQHVTTNDASRLAMGKVQYSTMCYPDGGIVDDLLVYYLGDRYMFVVNASNIQKDLEWILSETGSLAVDVTNDSDATSLLAVQGPRSLETLQKISSTDLSLLSYYSFTKTRLAETEMIVSRTGYTGELGFELYFVSSPSTGERVWDAVMTAGKEFGIKPVGLGARDTLRLEMGFCLYGNDIDHTTNPLEAGLGWITKLEKGEFTGRDALLKVREKPTARKLVGFIVEENRAFPRHGYRIRANGMEAGYVTSGTVSPSLEQGIGLGYLATPVAQPGTTVGIVIRDREASARVTKIPFLKK